MGIGIVVETSSPISIARTIIDANEYLTLATADRNGEPWATPVWFAHDDYQRFAWVSRPGTRHSRNIDARPRIGLVIFDSNAPIGTGQGVYAEGEAGPVENTDCERWLALYSKRATAHGGRVWSKDDVSPPSQFRLYVATVTAAFVLDEHDHRVEVDLR